MHWLSNMIGVMSIAWLDCKCMVLSCMGGEHIIIWCPTHSPSQSIRKELWEQETNPQVHIEVGELS